LPPAERARFRNGLSDADRTSLDTHRQLEEGRQLQERINLGRQLSGMSEAERNARPEAQRAQDRAALDAYRQFNEGRLTNQERDSLSRFQALEAYKANPNGEKLDDATANAMRQLESLRTYRADASGLRAFLDGRDLANRLDRMSAPERAAEMQRIERDPNR